MNNNKINETNTSIDEGRYVDAFSKLAQSFNPRSVGKPATSQAQQQQPQQSNVAAPTTTKQNVPANQKAATTTSKAAAGTSAQKGGGRVQPKAGIVDARRATYGKLMLALQAAGITDQAKQKEYAEQLLTNIVIPYLAANLNARGINVTDKRSKHLSVSQNPQKDANGNPKLVTITESQNEIDWNEIEQIIVKFVRDEDYGTKVALQIENFYKKASDKQIVAFAEMLKYYEKNNITKSREFVQEFIQNNFTNELGFDQFDRSYVFSAVNRYCQKMEVNRLKNKEQESSQSESNQEQQPKQSENLTHIVNQLQSIDVNKLPKSLGNNPLQTLAKVFVKNPKLANMFGITNEINEAKKFSKSQFGGKSINNSAAMSLLKALSAEGIKLNRSDVLSLSNSIMSSTNKKQQKPAKSAKQSNAKNPSINQPQSSEKTEEEDISDNPTEQTQLTKDKKALIIARKSLETKENEINNAKTVDDLRTIILSFADEEVPKSAKLQFIQAINNSNKDPNWLSNGENANLITAAGGLRNKLYALTSSEDAKKLNKLRNTLETKKDLIQQAKDLNDIQKNVLNPLIRNNQINPDTYNLYTSILMNPKSFDNLKMRITSAGGLRDKISQIISNYRGTPSTGTPSTGTPSTGTGVEQQRKKRSEMTPYEKMLGLKIDPKKPIELFKGDGSLLQRMNTFLRQKGVQISKQGFQDQMLQIVKDIVDQLKINGITNQQIQEHFDFTQELLNESLVNRWKQLAGIRG